ncbi:YqgE/AlgH family protein [Sandarakinorhabdus sp.]|uniref:YqgE/AlgH family protein n=1 Tax=Sandarakinorhabdus sp. TaxID=1916663 RepID=UPI003F707DD4
METPPFLSGQLLLSMPGIGDDRFDRTVIAMCLHDDQGALGLVVNRPHPDIRFHGILSQLDIDCGDVPDAPVLAGGPVEQGRGFVLHEADYAAAGTIRVGDAWAFTTTLDILQAIAQGRGPRRWHMVLGYAGWGAGQLDGEMRLHGWHIAPPDGTCVWDTPAERRWESAFALTGVAVANLSATPGRA